MRTGGCSRSNGWTACRPGLLPTRRRYRQIWAVLTPVVPHAVPALCAHASRSLALGQSRTPRCLGVALHLIAFIAGMSAAHSEPGTPTWPFTMFIVSAGA